MGSSWPVWSEKPILRCILVFLTGYDDFDYALSAVKLGVDDYLLKPFSRQDIEEMLGKIKQKLDKEEKEEQLQDLLTDKFEGNMAQKIQSHLADSQFSLKSLASDLGFSPTYLSSLIKKELGLPFQDYLVRERVKQAKLLLLTTDLKIYEIAEKVGFEDMNYFTQRFKQIAGVTPRQFKKGEVDEDVLLYLVRMVIFYLSGLSHSPSSGWNFLLSI